MASEGRFFIVGFHDLQCNHFLVIGIHIQFHYRKVRRKKKKKKLKFWTETRLRRPVVDFPALQGNHFVWFRVIGTHINYHFGNVFRKKKSKCWKILRKNYLVKYRVPKRDQRRSAVGYDALQGNLFIWIMVMGIYFGNILRTKILSLSSKILE